MNRPLILICSIAVLTLLAGCREKEAGQSHPSATPQFTARYDRSAPVPAIQVEQALQAPPTSLKLSQIASEIDYYIVGDVRFPVTQAIAIPDSDAFITFNNPRLYYRKSEKPSKRYAFKALVYKWNNEMNGSPLFYDKKTTRMLVALSGKDQETRETSAPGIPFIGELPPLDTMLTLSSYVYPETVKQKYPLHLQNDRLLGFSSAGYTLTHYPGEAGLPEGIVTYNLQGDKLCHFQFRNGESPTRTQMEEIPGGFQTAYWNTEQDKMTFLIPFCDTVYQLRDPQTVAPLYTLHFGSFGIIPAELPKGDALNQKIWLRTFYENPQALFMGLHQKGAAVLLDWLDNVLEYKPLLTHQAVYLKKENKTYLLPSANAGFENDVDGGLSFWPDGQTDDCLYMIRSVTEMRELVKRTGSPRQQKLLNLLDDKKVHERDYVMIVVR